MSESVETLAAKLLAAAIKEGRDDYVRALHNLVPVQNALEQLKADVSLFDETWKQRLLRSDYTSDEARAMFSEELIKNPKFVDFIVEATNGVAEKSTKYSLIRNMLGASLYSAASQAVENLADVPDFSNWLSTRTTHFSRANKNSYFYMTGNEAMFSRVAAVLFDKLDLEVPDNFDGEYTGKKIRWSPSKFDAVVDWVSELCDAPRATSGPDGAVHITNGLLIQAFKEERQRVQSKGEWHRNVFPRFVPVVANKEAAATLSSLGHIRLSPEFGFVGKPDGSTYFENKAEHSFSSETHPDLDPELIAAALTFLSHQEITNLRAADAGDSVFLIEGTENIKIDEPGQTPDILRVAMRYHRPEFLCTRYEGNLYEFERANVSTRGYLRGMPIRSKLRGDLSIQGEVLENPAFLDAFNSAQEMTLLKELHNPEASDPKQIILRQLPSIGDLKTQVEFAAASYKSLIAKLGYTPAMLFRGSEKFLHAFADELTLQSLDVSSGNTTRYNENPGHTSVSTVQRRLDARLGCLRFSEFKNLTADELLTKGARLKGEYDKEKICGILDRLGVVEVAKMAKTPAQRKFVIENFDVDTHFRDLPKAIRMAIGGKILENDLGM